MLNDFFRKRSTKRLKSADINTSVENSPNPDVDLCPPKEPQDEDFSGVELKEFARLNSKSQQDIWNDIRDGKLLARTENGFVYVYGPHTSQTVPLTALAMATQSTGESDTSSSKRSSDALAHLDQDSLGRLLMDQMALSREQNSDLLRFAQASIEQVKKYSEEMLKATNEKIGHRDAEIQRLHEESHDLRTRVESMKKETTSLRQKLEDLEMLNATLLTNIRS